MIEFTLSHSALFTIDLGYDASYRFPFSMIGRNGVNLRDKWSEHPSTYLSVCTDGFPNCFFSAGPNSGNNGGSFLIMLEHQVNYAVKVLQKLQRERLKSIEAKAEAVRDFDGYKEVRYSICQGNK